MPACKRGRSLAQGQEEHARLTSAETQRNVVAVVISWAFAEERGRSNNLIDSASAES
jgi:hypothetical protein